MIFPKNTYSTSMTRWWLIIALIALLLGSSGCTGTNRFWPENVLSTSVSSAQEKLDKAQEAMREKRYEEARELYKSIVETKQKAAVIQEARYGLASISLLTANDLAQYREGMHALQIWAGNSKPHAPHEDPRYLMPLLEKRAQTLEDLQECRKDNKTYQKRMRQLEKTHNGTLTKLQELRRDRKELRLDQKGLRRERKELLREQKQLRKKIRKLENLYNELLDTRKNL